MCSSHQIRGLCLLASLVILPWQVATAGVSLNESVSSNATTIADEDGDYSDWIELHNSGDEVVDLAGWGLTDAPSNRFKWSFPSGVMIAPGGHLLIWASNKDRRVAGQPLHTNFSIAAGGESLVLTQPSGIAADSVTLPALPRNTSYGRLPGQGTAWYYIDDPTPGAANTTAGYESLPIVPVFSIANGFYTEGFDLQITAENGWTVYYTLDGSDPHPSRVGPNQKPHRQSMEYTAPVPVASRAGQPNVYSMITTTKFFPAWLPPWRAPIGEVFKATIVRAAAYENATGRLGRTITQTYFVDPNIATRYAGMPVVSLVSDYMNLFDDASGIYVPGSASATTAQQNFMQGWTRPASIEFYETGGVLAFADIFDIKIQGSSSPNSMQKGLLVATGDDSKSSLIDYPLFAARGSSASGTSQFKRFMLRGWGSTRKWPVLFTDAHHHTLVAHSGLEIQDYRPVVVFINGEYWGLHELRETNKNSWYHQVRTGIDRDDPGYDLLDFGGSGADEGDTAHWDALMAFVNGNNLALDEKYQYVTTQVDVENLARYVAHCIISGKRDWPPQNESLWRPRTPDGRWRWTQFDMDHGLWGWSTPSHDMVVQAVDASEGIGPHQLFKRLLTNADFQRLFVNTYLDWLNSYFLTEVELAHFDAMKAELDPFIGEFNDRWPILTDDFYLGWQPGIDYGRNLISGNGATLSRRSHRRNQLDRYFKLGAASSLTLDADPAMGLIRCNSLVVDATTPGVNASSPYPWERIYYQNFPVALSAMPMENHRFLGWIVTREGVALSPLPGGDSTYYSKDRAIDLSLEPSGSYSAQAVFEEVVYQNLHVWNFQNASLTQPSSTVGGGLLASAPAPAGTIYLNTAAQDFDSTHLRIDHPIGAHLQWSLPTTGRQWPRLGFLTRRSIQGAGTQHVSYTLNGTNWTLLESYAVADAAPQRKVFDFSSIAGASNNPDFAVRITFAQGSGGTAGNNRFDDVVLSVASLQTYEAWADFVFNGEGMEDPDLIDPLSDFLSDGTPNLIKYALGLQPWEAVTPDRLRLGMDEAGRLFAAFHLDRSLSDITYRLETSPDLSDWSEVVYDSGQDLGPNTHGDMHEVVLPPDAAPRRFLRLAVGR